MSSPVGTDNSCAQSLMKILPSIVQNIGVVTIFSKGGRYSSVESSAPTILPPRVQIPSTPSILFQLIQLKLHIFHINWNVKKTKKRPILAHLKKHFIASRHHRFDQLLAILSVHTDVSQSRIFNNHSQPRLICPRTSYFELDFLSETK